MVELDALRQKAQQVRNEVQIGANTASRVGYVMEATIDAIEDVSAQSDNYKESLQSQVNANGTAIQMIQDEIEDLPSIRDNLDTLNSLKPEYYTEYRDVGMARLNAPDQISMSVGEDIIPPGVSINESLDEVNMTTRNNRSSLRMTEGTMEVWAADGIDFGTTGIKSKALVPATITQTEMEEMQTDGTWATFLAENPNVYVYEE